MWYVSHMLIQLPDAAIYIALKYINVRRIHIHRVFPVFENFVLTDCCLPQQIDDVDYSITLYRSCVYMVNFLVLFSSVCCVS
jgi:hypothetical protein